MIDRAYRVDRLLHPLGFATKKARKVFSRLGISFALNGAFLNV